MTELCEATLADVGEQVPVPAYERGGLGRGIVHLGVGGFHRAHEAMYVDALLTAGRDREWAITGVGLLPQDRRMGEVMRAQDCLYTLVVKHPDGSTEPSRRRCSSAMRIASRSAWRPDESMNVVADRSTQGFVGAGVERRRDLGAQSRGGSRGRPRR